jgi:methionyl aminopeptidase
MRTTPAAPPKVPKANDPCWCGSGQKFKRCHKDATDPVRAGRLSPTRLVPEEIGRPPYAASGEPPDVDEPTVKTADAIERIRRSAHVAADILVTVGQAVRPGITTDELDAICHEATIAAGAYPSPLNYHGYPKSLCTSVNEVVCHGIPDDRPLRDGDLVNLDVTAYREGVHGDTNATFTVGRVDPESRRLIDVTRGCLARAIAVVKPGVPLNAIGKAIQEHAESHGFGVVREFVGHGIGEQFHTGFQVPHYFAPRLTEPLEPGMVFTIEPMITAGQWRTRVWDDGWTAVTVDGRRTAQFEHTILVTDDGAEILTVPSDTSAHPYWVR